jgi:hypothetical protein
LIGDNDQQQPVAPATAPVSPTRQSWGGVARNDSSRASDGTCFQQLTYLADFKADSGRKKRKPLNPLRIEKNIVVSSAVSMN